MTIAKSLATIGDLISERDMLLYMLRGLEPHYNNFVSNSYLDGYEKILQK